MRRLLRRFPWIERLFYSAISALVYLGAVRLGLRFAFGPEQIGAFWPATGMLVAALLLWPARRRALLGTALVCNVISLLRESGGLPASLSYSVANVVECWVAAVVIERLVGRRPTMRRLREVLSVVLAALMAGSIGAILPALSDRLLKTTDQDFSFIWLFSDALSIFLLVPLLVSLAEVAQRAAQSRLNWRRGGKALVLGLLLALTVSFFVRVAPEQGGEFRPFVTILPLLWIALEFGPVGVSLAAAVGCALTLYQTARGGGLFAFVAQPQWAAILQAQLFWATSFTTTMVISAIYREMGEARVQQGIAESALKLSEERARMALETTSDALFDWNLRSGEVFVSSRYYTILGYEPFSYLPTAAGFAKRVHPDDYVIYEEGLAQAINAPAEPFDREIRLRSKDGRWIWFRVRGQVVQRDPDGKPARLVGTLVDVSGVHEAEAERRKLMAELDRSNERLELAMRAINDGIWDADLVTGRIYWSPRYMEMLGYREGELEPGDELWSRLVHPDDLPRVRAAYQAHFAGQGAAYEAEMRMRHKDGHYRWVLSRGVAVRDGEGRPVRFVGSHSDITERKLAEQALHESEERFRQVVEGAPEGMYIQTAGCYRYLNPAAVAMFGAASQDEILGRPVLDRVHPDSRDVERRRTWQTLYERRAVPFLEQQFLRLDGTVFDVEVTAVPFHFEGQDGAVVFFRDLTDRNRVKREMKMLEEQFRQSQKMEAIGRLAGGIAHDFNNLLMIIHSYAEMMLESLPASGMLRRDADEILKAAERGAGLTGQMLAFSRKQLLSPTVINLHSAIQETGEMIRRLIGEDVEFQLHAAEGLWPVEADADQVVQVLMNLCVNARDAMPEGGCLTVRLRNVPLEDFAIVPYPRSVPPADYVSLVVEDSGVGMAAEVLEHIFEPFYTTKGVGKGTGLGLSTVYGIIKQSGGYIWAESEVGNGSRFNVLLPRTRTEQGVTQAVANKVSRRGTETLLVVEDESALRESMSEFLRSQGYTIFEAASGAEALAVVEQRRDKIECVVTDVVMPKMNGYELARMLHVLRPGMRVIYMSGYTDDSMVREGLAEQGVTFLQKPFSLSLLAQKVRESFDRAPSSGLH